VESAAVAEAARLLVEARRSGRLAERFPPASRPASADEAEAIQQSVARDLDEGIAGWKVALSDQFGVLRGAILSSRLFPDRAEAPASLMPALGLEAEIAFRCRDDLPPRDVDYSRAEIEERVTALVGIEVVDSRFRDAASIPVIERAADCMSNGAFVVGAERPDWRKIDLSALPASLLVNGRPAVDRQIGGHATKDPIIPLIALANVLRATTGLFAGQIVTTGTYTGVIRCQAGDHVEAVFDGFGRAAVHLR
jgi:2-keto-4-pentenoate hydratase